MDSTWAGVTLAAVAVIPAYIGIRVAWVRAGVADGRAKRAEEQAEGALAAYQRMADSLDRLANARTMGGNGSVSGPPVSFVIEWRRGSLYTLRNLGPVPATEVRIDESALPIVRNLPDGVALRPLESHEFIISAVFGKPIPSQTEVTCAELSEPVMVPIPRKF